MVVLLSRFAWWFGRESGLNGWRLDRLNHGFHLFDGRLALQSSFKLCNLSL